MLRIGSFHKIGIYSACIATATNILSYNIVPPSRHNQNFFTLSNIL